MTLKNCQTDSGLVICNEILKRTGIRIQVNKGACQECTPEKLDKLCWIVLNRRADKLDKKQKQLYYKLQKKEFKELKPYKKLTRVQMAKHFALAVKRAAKERFTKVSEQIFTERMFCCSTCGASDGRCPYCGCFLGNANDKLRWKKSWLASEAACPSKETYPDLRKFPPKNFWSVCGELTSVIIPARNEKNLNRTIESVLQNAAGPVEVVVILDGYEDEPLKDERVKVIKHAEPLGRRVSINEAARIARGKYLFMLDAHCSVDEGFDTKLKCVCDFGSIVVPVVKALNAASWTIIESRPAGVFAYFDRNFREQWWLDYKATSGYGLIEQTLCFMAMAWMIRRDYFWKLGGYDESIGKFGFDGPEWSLKVWLHPTDAGQVLVRTDVICGHVFGTSNNQEMSKTYKWWRDYVIKTHGDAVLNLLYRFSPVPEWAFFKAGNT